MTLYITERFLPGITSEQLLDTARRAKSTTAKMTEEGTAVRYLHSTGAGLRPGGRGSFGSRNVGPPGRTREGGMPGRVRRHRAI